MSWISGESIFDRLLGFPNKDNVYYHCQKKTNDSKYNCKIVYGDHRVIPVYPDVPVSMHQQILEGVLNAPATIK
jgi:hypothetical protein